MLPRNRHDLRAEVLCNLLDALARQALNGGALGEGKVIQLAGVLLDGVAPAPLIIGPREMLKYLDTVSIFRILGL